MTRFSLVVAFLLAGCAGTPRTVADYAADLEAALALAAPFIEAPAAQPWVDALRGVVAAAAEPDAAVDWPTALELVIAAEPAAVLALRDAGLSAKEATGTVGGARILLERLIAAATAERVP